MGAGLTAEGMATQLSELESLGAAGIILKPWSERKRSSLAIEQFLIAEYPTTWTPGRIDLFPGQLPSGFKSLGAWSHPAFHKLDVPMTRDQAWRLMATTS